MLGVVDRRSKQVLPWKPSKARVGFGPAVNRAGDSHAVDAMLRHLRDAFLFQIIDREAAWRPPACV